MLFSKDMTYSEALKAFFIASDGKSKAEVDRIQSEFKKVVPSIIDREVDRSNQLTSYKI